MLFDIIILWNNILYIFLRIIHILYISVTCKLLKKNPKNLSGSLNFVLKSTQKFSNNRSGEADSRAREFQSSTSRDAVIFP